MQKECINAVDVCNEFRPFKMEREHLSHFTAAGLTYYDAPLACKELGIGTSLTLKAVPENKFDPRAIAIYYTDYKLGFVPRSENRILYKLLNVGFTAFDIRVQSLQPDAHPEQQLGVVVHLVTNK